MTLAGRRLDPLWLAAPGLLLLLGFLILPVLQLLAVSLDDPDGAGFTLAAYQRAFGVRVYIRVISNTFIMALQVMACCLVLGYPLAYWLSTLPKRRQRMMSLLVLLPFWTSALVKNFAWLVLLGRNGAFSGLLDTLGIAEPGSLLFNRGTVIFAMTHSMLPLAVVAMLSVMGQIDQRLVQAAGTLGATQAEAFWRVFFQLSMPGVASAGLLVFIAGLGYFITPALLGSPAETMMGQVIILQIQTNDNWFFASALAALLIGAALLSCLIFDRVFGLSAIAGGGGVQRRARSLPRLAGLWLLAGVARITSTANEALARLLGGHRFGWLLPAYCGLVIAVLVLPILALVPMAFTSSDFLSFPPPGFSLRWFAEYFSSPVWVAATLRSFGIGAATAVATLIIATLAGFGLARSPSRYTGAVFLLFLLPMIVPSIVVAVALFYLFAQLGLVATDLGIMIGHTVHALPIAFVILLATLKGYDWRLDQAAATLGANRWRSFWRVAMPLTRPGLIAAAIFAFLSSFEELTVALFIGGGLRSTLPKQLWDDVVLQVSPTLVAASVVVIVVVTALFLLAEAVRPKE